MDIHPEEQELHDLYAPVLEYLQVKIESAPTPEIKSHYNTAFIETKNARTWAIKAVNENYVTVPSPVEEGKTHELQLEDTVKTEDLIN